MKNGTHEESAGKTLSRVVFHGRLHGTWRCRFIASDLSYTRQHFAPKLYHTFLSLEILGPMLRHPIKRLSHHRRRTHKVGSGAVFHEKDEGILGLLIREEAGDP